MLAAGPALASDAANPIVKENRHKGTSRWDIPWAGYRITDDRDLNVKGYATAPSLQRLTENVLRRMLAGGRR
jgi:hypothetical protein